MPRRALAARAAVALVLSAPPHLLTCLPAHTLLPPPSPTLPSRNGQDSKHEWLLAEIDSEDAKKLQVHAVVPNRHCLDLGALQKSSVKNNTSFAKEVDPSHLQAADEIWDIAELQNMTEAPLLDVLRRRFLEGASRVGAVERDGAMSCSAALSAPIHTAQDVCCISSKRAAPLPPREQTHCALLTNQTRFLPPLLHSTLHCMQVTSTLWCPIS